MSVGGGLRDHPGGILGVDQAIQGNVIKGKFVLSYNDCEYIRELYEGYHIIEVERIHNLVMKERKPKYKELIIKNF